jgi:hypothetical protein
MRELSTSTFLAIDDSGIIPVLRHEGDPCLNCFIPLDLWPIGEHSAVLCHCTSGFAQDLSRDAKSFACNWIALRLEAQYRTRSMICWTRNQEAFDDQFVGTWLNSSRLDSQNLDHCKNDIRPHQHSVN